MQTDLRFSTMNEKFIKALYSNHNDCCKVPSTKRIKQFFEDLMGMLYPEMSDQTYTSLAHFESDLSTLRNSFHQLIVDNPSCDPSNADTKVKDFFNHLPTLYQRLNKDVQAMYEGDPAADSIEEVIRTYPGFYAIAAYRVAHQLHKQGIKIIPRAVTEIAHSVTGIDIHPGAVIGNYFCIDHGTGIVIGETTIIGDWVKVYQGVTLGALSVNKGDSKIQRHPTIKDHVVIYAGATILGGNTVIGEGSIIGGNVWIVKSVPSQSKLYYKIHTHD